MAPLEATIETMAMVEPTHELTTKTMSTTTTTAEASEGLASPSMENIRFSIQNFLHHKTGESIDNHYDLGELLGEGGFGVVYRGTHTKTGAIRAIKRMEKDPRDLEMNEEIIKEFNFLKELDHPNLLKAYDMFEDEPHFYIVSDLYGGGDLLDYLEEAGHLPEDKAKIFMNKLLSCIEYLHHNRFMVHRDLKLENVLLDENRDLKDMKLIDFGLALHFDDPQTSEFSDLVGSTSYVSPQVIEGTYSCKCDIWSCGVIAFGLLAGYTPFDFGDDGQTLQEILIGRVDFDDAVWDPVSDEAKDFICNLLAYEEADRPTAQQALTHPWLQQYRNDEMDESLKEFGNTTLKESILGLHHFRSKGCKLKQATCAIMASQLLAKDERETINDDFRFLNRSMGGSITKDDLKQAHEDLAIDYQDAAIDSVFEEVNYSGSGAISYSEFTIAMMFENGMVEDKLPLVFDMLDKDGDNKISNADLQAALNLKETTCAKMLQPLTLDEDGMLTYDMFQEAMLSNESLGGSNFNMEVSNSAISAEEEEEEEVVEPEEPPKPVVAEELPTKTEEEEPPKTPEGLTVLEKVKLVTWYNRFGRPDRRSMIQKVKKLGEECDITEEQILQLPWMTGGFMLHPKDVNAIMAAEATADGDIVQEAKVRRRKSEREDWERWAKEVGILSSSDTMGDDSLVNQPIKEEEAGAEVAEESSTTEPAAPTKPEEQPEVKEEKPVEATSEKDKEAVNKAVPAKNMNPNRNTSRAPLKVSSVLAGDPSSYSITTEEAKIDATTGKKETVVKSRPAQPRKERTIFSPSRRGPDFDWLSLGGVKLKVATIEERQKNRANFDWVSIVQSEEMSNSITDTFNASRRRGQPSEQEDTETTTTPAAKPDDVVPATNSEDERVTIEKETTITDANPKDDKVSAKPETTVADASAATEATVADASASDKAADQIVKEEEAKASGPIPPRMEDTRSQASTTCSTIDHSQTDDDSQQSDTNSLEDNSLEDNSLKNQSMMDNSIKDRSMADNSLGDYSLMDASQLSYVNLDQSERNKELEDTVHTGHSSTTNTRRMSSSARSTGSSGTQRRRGSNIYKPASRSAETQKMKFPKNRRRSSAAGHTGTATH